MTQQAVQQVEAPQRVRTRTWPDKFKFDPEDTFDSVLARLRAAGHEVIIDEIPGTNGREIEPQDRERSVERRKAREISVSAPQLKGRLMTRFSQAPKQLLTELEVAQYVEQNIDRLANRGAVEAAGTWRQAGGKIFVRHFRVARKGESGPCRVYLTFSDHHVDMQNGNSPHQLIEQ